VLIFRSSNSIVIAPANTGNLRISNTVVTTHDHTYSLTPSKVIPRQLNTDTSILIEPKIELKPAKCILKIAISTLAPIFPIPDVKGGYNVQPLPQPDETILLDASVSMEEGSNQNLRLFIRGKAMSTQLSTTGIIQLPNEPNAIGITSKKIIINA
jgi:hypothetical protein